MIYQALEVEHPTPILYPRVKPRKGEMLEVHRVAEKFEKFDFDIQRVKRHKKVAAIVLIEGHTSQCQMARVDIDTQLVDVHLATQQLFTVVVHVTLGHRSHQDRRQHHKSQQHPDNPQHNLQPFLHNS